MMGFRWTVRLRTALALAGGALLAGVVLFATLAPVVAEEAIISVTGNGKSSGLPVPRFVSLKSNKVNVRRGPSTDQAIVWVFSRAGLPVEVIAEFENWRRVRDSEGADGWVFHSLLSGRRTVLVSPWSKSQQGGPVSIPLHDRQSAGSGVVAQLQPGVIGDLVECDGKWCELSVGSYSGYVQQKKLWGVYRDEKIE